MSRNRLKDPFPFLMRIQLINLKKGLIDVRRSRDQRRLSFDNSSTSDPVKGIAPAKLLEVETTRLLKLVQKMNRPVEMSGISRRFVKEGESHRIMLSLIH